MSYKSLVLPVLAVGLFAAAAPVQAQTKVGIINIQGAIVGTKEGQKAAQELETKVAPRRKTLEGRQTEIAGLRDQLQKGSNTMSQEQRDKLARDIDTRTKSFNRELEDANAESEGEQQRILQDLGQRMMAVIDKYARDNGYALILDVSNPQTPVIYAGNQIDVTQDVIALYDKGVAATPGGAPAGGAAARPATPGAAPPAGGAAAAPARPAGAVPAGAGAAPPAAVRPGTVAPAPPRRP